MNSKISAEIYTVIQANKKDVWDSLVNPEKVKIWFFETTLNASWEPGSPVVFTGEWNGKKYEGKGIVLAYKHEQMLQYTYYSSMSTLPDTPDNYQIITYRIGGDDGNVTVTIIEENIPDINYREHSIKNWETVLQNLKKFHEANELIGN